MLKIGTYKPPTNIFLAPLAGCTDLPFRLISREHGAKFCFYEMIDANSLTHRRRESLSIIKTVSKDSPIAAQLLGSDHELLLDASLILLKYIETPFLDINSACPAKKVIKKKAGAMLLRDGKELARIVKTLSGKLKIPITVKMRIGYDKKDLRLISRIARECEDNGAACLFVHGRLATQGYSGDVDYHAIRAVKESVRIPVFGVGSVFSGSLAKKMFDETSCDGICVARGALGNPWIFKEIDQYLKNGTKPVPPSIDERLKVLKKHLGYMARYTDYPKDHIVGPMRKVALWYIREFPTARKMRESITRAKDYHALTSIINSHHN